MVINFGWLITLIPDLIDSKYQKNKDDQQSLQIIRNAKYTFNFSIIDNTCKYYVHLLLGKEI